MAFYMATGHEVWVIFLALHVSQITPHQHTYSMCYTKKKPAARIKYLILCQNAHQLPAAIWWWEGTGCWQAVGALPERARLGSALGHQT